MTTFFLNYLLGPSLSYIRAPSELHDVGICLLEQVLKPGQLTFVPGNRDGVPLQLCWSLCVDFGFQSFSVILIPVLRLQLLY